MKIKLGSVSDVISAVGIVLLVGFAVYNFNKPAQGGYQPTKELTPPKDVVSLKGAEIKGNPTAPVALIVYSDFECPFCSKFATEILPELENKYPNQIQVAFRNLPLAMHQAALPVAISAKCAGEQGKFWEAHDGIFKNQKDLKGDWQLHFAKDYKLDESKYQACTQRPDVKQLIEAEAELGKKYGITGTPAIFIGKVVEGGVKVDTAIPGAAPVSDFSKSVEKLLKVN